jgi:hypothetical protein
VVGSATPGKTALRKVTREGDACDTLLAAHPCLPQNAIRDRNSNLDFGDMVRGRGRDRARPSQRKGREGGRKTGR